MNLKTSTLKTTLLLFSFLFSASIWAGNEEKFYKEATQETEQYKVELSDIVAEGTFSKMKVTVTNKTNHYLYFDATKCTFVLGEDTYHPDERLLKIKPNDSRSRVLNVSGSSGFNPDAFQLKIDGISFISLEGKKIEAKDFQLPVSRNDFEAGPFEIELDKLKKKTDNTTARFKVTYKGDHYGILDPDQLGVRIEDGKEFANENRGNEPIILQKGDDEKITAEFTIEAKIIDMQFATMWIIWRDTFREVEAVKGKTLEFELQAK